MSVPALCIDVTPTESPPDVGYVLLGRLDATSATHLICVREPDELSAGRQGLGRVAAGLADCVVGLHQTSPRQFL